MSWNEDQCRRLAAEKKLVDTKFPGFIFINPKDSDNASIKGHGNTRTGLAYTLTIAIPKNYPNSRVHLYVTEPNPLRTYENASTINGMNSSHEFHTYSNGPNSCVNICFMSHWHPGMTITGAIWKGILWMEAYAHHLQTGKTIDYILNNNINDIVSRS